MLTQLVVADAPEPLWGREIALLNTYQGYGWAAGLLLGVVWSAVVGRAVPPATADRLLFVACAGFALLAGLLLRRWMPAPSGRRLRRVDHAQVARLLATGRRGVRGATFLFTPNRLYWATRRGHPSRLAERFSPTLAAYFVGVFLFFSGFSAFFAPLPLYLTGVGFSSETVFGLYLVSSLGSAAFFGGAGRLSGEVDVRLLQAATVGLRGLVMPLVAPVGAALTAGIAGTVVTGVLFLLVGGSWAVIAVTAGTIVTRVAPSRLRGEALGVYAAMTVLAGGVGSIAGGALAGPLGFPAAFGLAGVVILAGAGLVLALRGISARTGAAATDAESPG